ncbi:hypothetical protein GQ43DRAFT_471226 [Delitschia confertaspora ATCC 74209]|uniref:GET complex, subunit GET2 n=1 Tax=Delitschia confertaspora ATCC 74209 TaxID=1513339 RepID=A0A9P4MTH6_9PLEO|nr:hypothetical protein GQ43DRAFT_471226 [Delitschia confertaspora ATCC 74209]
MAMLQQMMGGAGGIPGMEGMGGMPGLGGMPGGPGGPFPQGGEGSAPPGLAQLMQAMQQGGGQQLPPPSQSSAYLWRIVHSVFSLLLAVYIIVQTPFTGSKISRTTSPVTPLQSSDDWTLESPAETFKHFFYIFATFEVMMQTTRFFVERGQLQGGGMLSTIGQMLPEPWAGIVRTVGRYGVIWKTVVSDAMVVVFVLGLASWWRGGMVA